MLDPVCQSVVNLGNHWVYQPNIICAQLCLYDKRNSHGCCDSEHFLRLLLSLFTQYLACLTTIALSLQSHYTLLPHLMRVYTW